MSHTPDPVDQRARSLARFQPSAKRGSNTRQALLQTARAQVQVRKPSRRLYPVVIPILAVALLGIWKVLPRSGTTPPEARLPRFHRCERGSEIRASEGNLEANSSSCMTA